MKLLDNIQKYLLWWIFGAVALGLSAVKFFGGYGFSPLICLFAALVMIYPSLVPLSFDKVGASLKNYRIIAFSLFVNFIVSPAAAFVLGYVFLRENPELWIGLMLLSLLPGGGMATTWALKSKADMPSAIGIIITNLFVAILAVPPLISLALARIMPVQGAAYSADGTCPISVATNDALSCARGSGVDSVKIALAIFLIVVVPLVLAYGTQKVIKKQKGAEYFESIKGSFGKISNLGLVLVLVALMALGSNEVIFSNPAMIARSSIPLVLFYGIVFSVSMVGYRIWKKSDKGKSLVWGSYLRYVTLALGMAISLVFQNPALSASIVIIVMSYFIQIPTSAWLARYFEKTGNNLIGN
ncbi:MAG: Arsenical-resistance protein [Candidatus Moranbacteria bacterium GW2011_GWE1_49_15]|nr:MAG: Arsenical-resistance protein [Candidatus Moranbacteria bacterium GW2011_GWE2_47_10]KKW06428.1 MAG: Arsenical-resistance protein [Candidatus Moranbacteria bacterium GW2011_GWE1_49_15]HBP00660.1 hypothetical protein [Candidatus Moranbacteria bacterium]